MFINLTVSLYIQYLISYLWCIFQITIEDMEVLKEKVTDFALSVSMPDLNAITQFFISKSITNPLKPKEVELLVSLYNICANY